MIGTSRTRLIVYTTIALQIIATEYRLASQARAQTAAATTEAFPLQPLRQINEAFASNDPKVFRSAHATGTADEEAFDAAEQALLIARGKMLAAYRAKIDRLGKTPIPD